ncbi:MAG: YhdP family protein [Halofilum sp. (in: g-proteobacteria)]|nr:YhdP family protein [Halofilum sp. (in: g-proteobacteria)]
MIESHTHAAPGPLVRMRQLAWRWLWRAVAFVLIATAVLLTLARLLLPFAGEYRDELEQRVESYLGHPVTIGQLDIDWQGLGPRIRMSDLQVQDIGPEGEAVVFDHAYIRLRPGLHDGAPTLRLDDFSLIGFTLQADMDEQGRIHALGAELGPVIPGALAPAGEAAVEGNEPSAVDDEAGTSGSLEEGLERIFSIRRLQIREAALEIRRPDGETVRWGDLGLTLVNAGDQHRLAFSVTPPPSMGTRFTASMQFTGRPADYREWRASLYLDARGLSLRRLSDWWPGLAVRAEDGRLDARLWSDWNGGHLLEARAELDAEDLALASADATAVFERVGGRLRLWQPTPEQWQIDVAQLRARRDGRSWGGGNLSYALEDDGDWRIAADFLRAEDIAAVAALLPLGEEPLTRLRAHAPRGDLHGMTLAMSAGGDFQLRGDFRDLGWTARGDIPGITGLDGSARLRSDGGRVALESSGVEFNAPALFRGSLPMQELSATVSLQPAAGGFVVDAPRVRMRNKDLRGRGRARIEITDGGSTGLDLQFEYRDGVATAVPRYLPAGIMPEPVVEWLDQAFLAGRVPSGSFILRGPAEGFPYREHDGIFDVHFEVVDTTLHYGEGWPAIEGLGGHVRFSGPSLEITAGRGATRGLRLQQGRARIDDLRAGLLEVEVDAAGPLDDMLGVVTDSPIGPRFEPVLDGTEGRGDAELSLALSVPVETVEDTRVDGRVRFDGAGLSLPRQGLEFDRIRGSAAFTEDSVTIDELAARLRGRPVRVQAATREGVAQVRIGGRFGPAELLPALAGDGLLSGISGRSDWRIDVEVPLQAEGQARLTATSDLAGTRVDLPAPLGKPAGDARRLRVTAPLTGGIVRGSYGAETRFELELRPDDGALSMRRAGLAFAEAARLPVSSGLRVSGTLERLPAAPWAALAAGSDGAGAGLPLVELDLRAGRMDLNGYGLSQAHLLGQQQDKGGWTLDVASNEAVGRVTWPGRESGGPPVDVRFEWIDVALIEPPADAEGAPTRVRFDDPSGLPPLDVRVERLKLRDYTLQDFNMLTGGGGDSVTVHQVGFRTGHLRVGGQGQWQGGRDPRTNLRLVVRSDDFGAGLSEIGHGGLLADGDGKVTLDLDWPGAPWEAALATIGGDVEINIDDGVLTDVKPGAARLLGLFSLEAMPFRSLLQSGLIFSEMKGRVDLADGNAYTKLLKIDSALGLIKIYGRTGLVARDYDQRIVVQPELATSLPVIGFLSGGPLAGAAIAVFQGLMRNLGEDIEKTGRVEYTVTGSWDDPVIERENQSGPQSGDGVPEIPR